MLVLQELAAYECYCSCDKGDACNGKPEGQQGVAGFGKMLGGGCLLRFCGFGNRGLVAGLAGFGRGARLGLGVLGPLAEERHGAGKRIAVVPFYGAAFVGVSAVKRPAWYSSLRSGVVGKGLKSGFCFWFVCIFGEFADIVIINGEAMSRL